MGWYWAEHEDNEHWYGPHASREEALSHARLEGRESAWVQEGTPMKHCLDLFDMDDTYDEYGCIAQKFDCANEELYGEDGQNGPDTWTDEHRKELVAVLNKTFAEWATKHGYDKAYMLDMPNDAEKVELQRTG